MVHESPLVFYEKLVELGGGLMKGKFMLQGGKSMHPDQHYIQDHVDLYEHIDDPTYLAKEEAFESWYETPIDLPGQRYLQVIVQLFKENSLAKGTFVGLGRKPDVHDIACPVLFPAGASHDITEPLQVRSASWYLGTPKERIVQKTVAGAYRCSWGRERYLNNGRRLRTGSPGSKADGQRERIDDARQHDVLGGRDRMKIQANVFRVREGTEVELGTWPTRVAPVYKSKIQYRAILADHIQRLSAQQSLLYADNRYAVLFIFQAMDAAGKDGVIKHVMSGVNPQGCQVFSFKHPSAHELQHDFLWRTTRNLPERGHIGIFNRSYYEEVLILRVHPEILCGEGLASTAGAGESLWHGRYRSINDLEHHLYRNDTRIVKFFLHLS